MKNLWWLFFTLYYCQMKIFVFENKIVEHIYSFEKVKSFQKDFPTIERT